MRLGIRDDIPETRRNAERLRVLLREVDDDRARIGRNDRLIEHLPRQVLTHADKRLREIADNGIGRRVKDVETDVRDIDSLNAS
jgi:hypothetical protein